MVDNEGPRRDPRRIDWAPAPRTEKGRGQKKGPGVAEAPGPATTTLRRARAQAGDYPPRLCSRDLGPAAGEQHRDAGDHRHDADQRVENDRVRLLIVDRKEAGVNRPLGG